MFVEDIGMRLRLAREAVGKSQIDYAKAAKISPSAYNQYEKARIRPALDAAMSLCDAHGLSLDWIYRGIDTELPADLAQAIRALEQIRA